jgi:hypothetical protein
VPSKELEAQRDVDAWFLGHIHKPHLLQTERPIGYLGSLVGLDRGETGPRGPWLVTVEGRGEVRASQVSLGPVQWESTRIDVSNLPEDAASAEDFLRDAVHNQFRYMRGERPALTEPALRVVAVSIDFVGQPPSSKHVSDYLANFSPADLQFEFPDQTWAAVKLTNHTRPAVDLTALMQLRSPLGVIATVTHTLESGGEVPPELASLVTQAASGFTEGDWSLDSEDWPMPQENELLLSAARGLLDVLLEQQKSQAVS